MDTEKNSTVTPITQRETTDETETQVCLIRLTAKLQIKFIYKLNTYFCSYSFPNKSSATRKHFHISIATKELNSVLRSMHTPSCNPENKEATVLAATDLTSSRVPCLQKQITAIIAFATLLDLKLIFRHDEQNTFLLWKCHY